MQPSPDSEAAIDAALRTQGVASDLAARLARYGKLVLAENRMTNLTAAREPDAFAEHILDALTLANDINGPLIDLGSGAGLPGIPLAIASGERVVLIDSIKKKAQFLARTLVALHLDGEAVDGRAETLAQDSRYRESFACATARAVASASSVAELTVPFLRIGGRALLQRGTMDDRERQAVIDAAPMLGAEVVEERLLAGARRIVVLLKTAPTPRRFPRRDGLPQKRPLCA